MTKDTTEEVTLTMAQQTKLRVLSEHEVMKKVNIAKHCLYLTDLMDKENGEVKKACHFLALKEYLKLVKKEIIED